MNGKSCNIVTKLLYKGIFKQEMHFILHMFKSKFRYIWIKGILQLNRNGLNSLFLLINLMDPTLNFLTKVSLLFHIFSVLTYITQIYSVLYYSIYYNVSVYNNSKVKNDIMNSIDAVTEERKIWKTAQRH